MYLSLQVLADRGSQREDTSSQPSHVRAHLGRVGLRRSPFRKQRIFCHDQCSPDAQSNTDPMPGRPYRVTRGGVRVRQRDLGSGPY